MTSTAGALRSERLYAPPRIDQGAAAGVARDAGADEGAGFISWRWRGHY
jgi:hypothetical protein